MKSILILGASSLQVPLINYVKDQGYRAIVVSIPGNYPGFDIADRSIYCDIRDAEAILSAIGNEDIAAVLTDETDISVPTVAVIAEKLGLPGNKPSIAQIYSNKNLMRRACKNAKVSVPHFYMASKASDVLNNSGCVNYPAIMKPEDNQGSRGVFVVESDDDIIKKMPISIGYSSSGRVIVEDFFKGNEVVVEGYVFNGEYLNWGIGERRYFDLPNLFIPSQTIFPADISQAMKESLLAAEKRLHSYLKPSFGMIHSEYLIREDTGEFVLVETALRGGGVFISSHLVPSYTGFDNYKLLLNCALGKGCDIESIKSELKNLASAYVCFYLPEGIIESVNGVDEVTSHPNVKLFSLDGICKGAQTQKITNKTQRLGPIIVEASSRREIDDVIKEIQQSLIITVRTPSGNLGKIIWT